MEKQKLKVLIVDDNEQFLKVLKNNLENKDCIVQTAHDQKLALSKLMNQAFHVVFVDCLLNKGHGIELAQSIKRILGDSVEIVMMSGVLLEKSLSNYVELGIRDFLPKPVSDGALTDIIERIKEQYVYGNKYSLLDKLFNPETSSTQMFKFLVSLKKARDFEFFLYLNSALVSGESFSFQFDIQNVKHTITGNKKAITDYENSDTASFLEKLLSKNYITKEEASHLKNKNQSEIVQHSLTNCILSSTQIQDIKYEMLFNTLRKISKGIVLSPIQINFSTSNDERFRLLSQGDYADLLFVLFKQNPSEQLFGLFTDDIMRKSLIFEKQLPKYLPEADSLVSELKEGMKLKGVYNKHSNNKNSFFHLILYILLKGNVSFSKADINMRHNHLYERYQKLYDFLTKSKTPKEAFSTLGAFNKSVVMTSEDTKNIYLTFVKHNHPDVITHDLPEDLLKTMSKVLSKIKNLYDFQNDADLRKKQEVQIKKEGLEKAILLTKKKEILERYLEEKKYKEALSLIETVSNLVMDKDFYLQLIYLWIHIKAKELTKAAIARKYMKNVHAETRNLQKEKLYFYVMGLYHKSKNQYDKAKMLFHKAQELDPSFQPCYPAIKECSIQLLENKDKGKAFMKFKSFVSGDKKTKKAV